MINEAGCGMAVPSGDSNKLAENILELYGLDNEARNKMGMNGFLYYKNHFLMDKCIDNLEDIINT